MTRLFSLRLAERVFGTLLITFFATYATELGAPSSGLVATLGDLSVAHKAFVAAVAAALQLAVSTIVAPHVGDPQSPDLIPNALIDRIDRLLPKGTPKAVEVTLTDVVTATLEKVRESHPEVATTADEVAEHLIKHAAGGAHAA
jgi:hypothetical protein